MIQQLIDQLSAMAQMEGMADHVAELNTILETSQSIKDQFDAHAQAMASMASEHEQAMATWRAETEAREQELQAALAERDGKIGQMMAATDNALAKYKTAILAANPDIPPELIAGYSIDEIDVSVAAARQIVEKIRAQEAERAVGERVPAGAPVRGGVDVSNMSALEKIRYGLSERG